MIFCAVAPPCPGLKIYQENWPDTYVDFRILSYFLWTRCSYRDFVIFVSWSAPWSNVQIVTTNAIVGVHTYVWAHSNGLQINSIRLCTRNNNPKARFQACCWIHRTSYEAKQGCGVVSCTTFSYWGARWAEVLVLIWHHIICIYYSCMYVRLLLLIFHWIFHFLVGTW